MQLVKQAREHLALLDDQAAKENNHSGLFVSEEHFPEVSACRRALSEAELVLRTLLPDLAKQAGVNKVEYISIMNQVCTPYGDK
jgi:hypothetical protein